MRRGVSIGLSFVNERGHGARTDELAQSIDIGVLVGGR